MNRNQFELLSLIEREGKKKLTQRYMAEETGMSLGMVNKTLKEAVQEKLIGVDEKKEIWITNLGLEQLEPYRVKRAVILAAGVSSRMMPIILNTPKPLVRVHGKPIIETILDALFDVGIKDITIVVGYMKEQFALLKDHYPNLQLMENPFFNETNNVSSAWLARKRIARAYVLEADLVIQNPNVVRKYEYCSNHLGVYCERTDDWCFVVKKDLIQKMQIGGENCYRMCGISFWTDEDGKKLEQCLDEAWNRPGGKERYWDEIPFREYKDIFEIEIRKCKKNDLMEVDTWKELQRIDPVYTI